MKMEKYLIIGVVLLLVASVFGTVTGIVVGSEEDDFGNAAEDPIEIEDWHDVNETRDDLEADYVLMNDLDEDTDGYNELVNTEDGWEPINDFEGTFDGNGYEIGDLYIDRADGSDVGLFGSIDPGAEISDIGVVDADVSGKNRVGVLVGDNSGTVKNSSVTGEVSGENYVGGLLGDSSWIVSTSHAAGNVSGNNYVGGLIGNNQGLWVKTSYAEGDVSGDGWYVGGLIGHNSFVVGDSYATGDVSADEQVGGLVGYNEGAVNNSYAIGAVSGNEEVGGLVGLNDGTVRNSFWNIDTTGQSVSDGGTGKTTAEMKDVDTYTDTDTEGLKEPWDFVADPNDDEDDKDEWDIDEDGVTNDGYPFLRLEEIAEEEEDGIIPGFTPILLLIASIIAVAIYQKKSKKR